MLQFLAPDGSLQQAFGLYLPEAALLRLYRLMFLTRALDMKMVSLHRQGRVAFWTPCIGQEACHIGSAFALQPTDWIFLQYREHGVPLVRNVQIRHILAQAFGNSGDPQKGRQMAAVYGFREVNVVTASPPIATQIPHAVGAALAAKIRGDRVVTLAYFGDGASSAGDFHAGLNFAGVFRTPTVFLLQNNQWAISVPVSAQTRVSPLSVKAEAYGFEGVTVDGNDVLAVYAATLHAAERARSGAGPTLIEAVTYRLAGHSTADDPSRYRREEEVAIWRARDPLRRFRIYLEHLGLWDPAREAHLHAGVEKELSETVREVAGQPPPPVETLFTDVYADVPWHLREQQEQVMDGA
jgi:TPP-dependent pyruvate/acetoin dehydrogenase alpha subunit